MFNNRKDDDVIVLSEEDVTYENADENGAPADSAQASARDDAAVSDQHDRTVPTGTGRLSAVATPGDDAADEAADDGPPYGTSSPYGTSADAPASSGPDTAGSQRVDAADDADDVDDVNGIRPGTDAEADGADTALGARDTSPDTRDDTSTAAANGTVADGTVADGAVANGTVTSGTVNGAGPESAIPVPGAAPTAAAPADAAVPSAAAPATPAVAAPDADSNWPQIQALFVDDPQSAVRQAADVAGGAVAALVAAAKNREQTMRDTWQSDSTGTEDLRTALRGYRDLASRLSALAQEL
jgi:hypothetical protein